MLYLPQFGRKSIIFIILFSFTFQFTYSQNCPGGTISVRNGQGGNSCHPSDVAPGGYSVSGSWIFASGPASNMTIYTVYRNGVLYQSGSNAPSGNADIWWGGYLGSNKSICFYSRTANVNTPASADWAITFSSSSGQQCTFTVGSGGAVSLPVTWETVSAEKQNGQSILRWSTASEQNTRDFVVEYSNNAQQWTSLFTIPAAGNSTTTRNYSYVHQNPLKGNNYNYYRILQRDIDDKFSYSKIVSIIFNEPGADLQVYPNPVQDQLTIFLAESQLVRLVNAAGATVWKGQLPAGRNTISVNTYSRGVYMLTAGKQSQRVLIR